uniref:Large ribosomal subunit protein uL6c n=1 Tax=Caulacanthus okamurae TaxID=152008 RepID=A0A6H1U8W5_9FLOR|nr:50S ribosomal protein L6 [Caulacanthus okamurae]QIZ74650.1 50S ribosomal protein L6 [Caulacanthus okamurae]
MSRIGKRSIILKKEIKVNFNNSIITIEGPKGKLLHKIPKIVKVTYTSNEIKLSIDNNTKKALELYGLSRTLINNMVIGVSQGFSKKLKIQGVGYRCQMNENNLILNVGYSHPIVIKPPKNIKIKVEDNTHINVLGINKELVGQVAAKIRATRPPEPYKGKGIKYLNEVIKRKVGKAGK